MVDNLLSFTPYAKLVERASKLLLKVKKLNFSFSRTNLISQTKLTLPLCYIVQQNCGRSMKIRL